jgi:hypothetical protein
MVCNVGGVDRVVRVLVGIVLAGVALYFFPLGITKVVLLTVAASSLATAWFGFCFINKFFGINTAHHQNVES